MPGASWISHRGKKILFLDFARSDTARIVETINQAKPIISTQPEQSILCLVETTESRYSIDTANALKEFTMHNKPYMKMTAVIGIEGLQKVILSSVIVFTRRTNLVIKATREEALDFLAAVQ